MKENIDLHLHSYKSDGQFSPSELVEKAVEANLKAIALTDHDTVDGIKEAEEASKGRIFFIPGIEFSCTEDDAGFPEVHVLGYFIDYRNNKLLGSLEKIKQERIAQKKKIIDKLSGFGYEISFDEVNSLVKGEISRVHIAKVLKTKYPDKFSTGGDVFKKYISKGRPAYVERTHRTGIRDAIKLIDGAGGFAVLAHPGMFDEKEAIRLIELFIQCGGRGLEIFYPYRKAYPAEGFSQADEKNKISFFLKIAEEKGLMMTGGSDFHGDIRDVEVGEMNVPFSHLEKIMKSLGKKIDNS